MQTLGTGVGNGGSVGISDGSGESVIEPEGSGPTLVDGGGIAGAVVEAVGSTDRAGMAVVPVLEDGAPPGWLGSTSGTSRIMGEGCGCAISVALTSSIEVPKVSSNGMSARVAAVASQVIMATRLARCSE